MKAIPLEQFLIIDIETASCAPDFESLTPQWQALWTEKVGKSQSDDIDPGTLYGQKAGVMAEFSKVICMGVAYFIKEKEEYRLETFSLANESEREVLVALIALLHHLKTLQSGWRLAGHNIREFDVPFLCRRFLINGLPIPAPLDFQNKKPWETNLVDTFQYWRFGDYKQFTSLSLLAAALSIPSPKDDLDGSKVGEVFWKEKNLARIETYCRKDVITVANILLRFKGLPCLNEALKIPSQVEQEFI